MRLNKKGESIRSGNNGEMLLKPMKLLVNRC